MLTPLCELARRHGSDKYGRKHSYTGWYFSEFAARRETVRTVVEIGVGTGASLRMWRDFFPNARIYGADNDPARVFSEERIEVWPCDQASAAHLGGLLALTGPDVDLFIDDGSHVPAHQAFTFLTVFPQLEPGAVYVVEDVTVPAMPADNYYGYPCENPALDYRARYDNRLVVVRHA